MSSRAPASKRRRRLVLACAVAAALGLLVAAVASADPSPQPQSPPTATTTPRPSTTPTPSTTPAPSTTTAPTPTTQPTPSPSPSGEEPGSPPAGATSTQPSDANRGQPDFLRDIGADDPFCKDRNALTAEERNACDRSGAIAHPYPISSYGIDWHIDVTVFNPVTALPAIGQWLVQQGWMALVYLVKLVLLLLSWAFRLDLVSGSMQGVADSLNDVHTRVFGTPWLLAAFAVVGLWGIWNGLVRMRTSQTLIGLAATVGLMILALGIIQQPMTTVGNASKLANDGSLEVLTAVSHGTVRNPTANFGDSQAGLFDSLVKRPWCVLEFGDASYCNKKLPHQGPNGAATVADLWLGFPAGSGMRTMLYALTKGDNTLVTALKSSMPGIKDVIAGPTPFPGINLAWGGIKAVVGTVKSLFQQHKLSPLVEKDPDKVAIQGANGAVPRLALFPIIAFGLLGAMFVLLWIALRLIVAAVMTLLLLLMAPLALFAPAFGESGRATFVAWLKRLFAAVFAKFIYALLLGMVLLVANMLADIRDTDNTPLAWFATWILEAILWWGIFLKRKLILGFVSVDTQRQQAAAGGGGGGRGLFGMLMATYFGSKMAAAAGHGIARVTGLRAWRANRLARDVTEATMAEQAAERGLTDRAAQMARDEHSGRVPYAQRVADRGQELDGQLNNARDQLRDVDQQIKSEGIKQERQLGDDIRGLENQRNRLQGDIDRRQREMAGTEDQVANEEALRDRSLAQQTAAQDAASAARDKALDADIDDDRGRAAQHRREAAGFDRDAQRYGDEAEKRRLAGDKLQNKWIRDDDLNTRDRGRIGDVERELADKKRQLAAGVTPSTELTTRRTALVNEINRLQTIVDNPVVKANRADADRVLREHVHGYTPRDDEIRRNMDRIKDATPGYRWREEHGRVRRGQGFRRRRSRWRA